MLNYDAELVPFGSIPEQTKPFFLRPVEDTKAFTGFVEDWPSYLEWRSRVAELNEPGATLTLDTPVMVCSKKEIWSETRTWIVCTRVQTASGYKVGTIKRYTTPDQVDQRITDFASECAKMWSPDDAYVMDIADTPDGLKIVEVNNLNSAGFYKGDMAKVVQAIEDWADDCWPCW